MLEVLGLFFRLSYLACVKLLRWLSVSALALALNGLVSMTYPLKSVLASAEGLFSLFSPKRKFVLGSKRQAKIGVVLITRFPIPERASAHEESSSDNLIYSLRNGALFERVIGELAASTVLSWIRTTFSSGGSYEFPDAHPHLFLVYSKSYTGAFPLGDWFSVLPDHQLARCAFDRKNDETDSQSLNPGDQTSQSRSAEIISQARYNLNHRKFWEDPEMYCSSRALLYDKQRRFAQFPMRETEMSLTGSHNDYKFEYVTVEGLKYAGLFEVALRAALRANCDYILVLNPRAIGVQPRHLSVALQLLTGSSTEFSGGHKADAVLGITTPHDLKRNSFISSFSPLSTSSSYGTAPFPSPTGLYLVGLRGGGRLTLGAHLLADSVEWSTSSTATRFWTNLTRHFSSWNVVCLRERLEEIMKPQDLPYLERCIGIHSEHLLVDSVSVIIPMGPGHPDDLIDTEEDVELVEPTASKALATTLEIAVHNASGTRPIEIIIIDSHPPNAAHVTQSSSNVSLASGSESNRFLHTRMRSMMTVKLHHYRSSAGPESEFPKRGQLIRYASQNLAKGSMLLFVEPGVQLPPNWDSAIYHSLQRPGIGMGCFAYRLHLHEKYIHRKSITWALNCWLANYAVSLQTHRTEVPIVGQPYFIYSHYLTCLGGYPESSRTLHPIDLALACRERLGRVIVTRSRTAAAGVPANFALHHGACRTALYTVLLAVARCFGATEEEIEHALGIDLHSASIVGDNGVENARQSRSHHPLPLVQPDYLDGY
ncbi:unnamed protein product [Calicophoron daubneyi]|uniref:Uncharacterized protein n=1 Tax=Calicophoron daubneyi TaxID=300641 RepID=A0AAV2TWS2_CALDB